MHFMIIPTGDINTYYYTSCCCYLCIDWILIWHLQCRFLRACVWSIPKLPKSHDRFSSSSSPERLKWTAHYSCPWIAHPGAGHCPQWAVRLLQADCVCSSSSGEKCRAGEIERSGTRQTKQRDSNGMAENNSQVGFGSGLGLDHCESWLKESSSMNFLMKVKKPGSNLWPAGKVTSIPEASKYQEHSGPEMQSSA